MGRNPRIEYSGAIYHVIQRGNNREYIFRNEIHKGYLVKIIRETKAKMPFNIFAYVFMDNHYHILMQTFETPLSTLMHRINNRYSKYYNYTSRRTGHVFENRYKSILVQDKSYLLALIKYIHSNPVKANMCPAMDAYKWSSDVFYRRNMRNIVDIGFALDMLSLDGISAIRKYIEFMDDMELYNEIKRGARTRSLTEFKLKYIVMARGYGYSFFYIGKNICVSDNSVLGMLKRSENSGV